MKQDILKLKGHVIICGYGRNGKEAARVLQADGETTVIIEKNPSAAYPENEQQKYFLCGDALSEDVLKEAGIQQAKALITTLPDDADNVFVVLTVKAMNPDIRIISRAAAESSVKKLKMAGAGNVIMPDKLGGVYMAGVVKKPDVNELVEMLGIPGMQGNQMEELKVNTPILLSDLNPWHLYNCQILGIKSPDGQLDLNPAPNRKVECDEILIVWGNPIRIQELRKALK